ncbi:hypothetical protein GPUN_1009 [Glaciecola punicea ACAM 611]|uniref:Uncharacterized protein n=1 Tax=Glaciecola punicea ACAM 611 TaxID=1121923 RepID=H5TA13_9ALTE|nr:hypothetical protein GPUN_1009 [Glaciecola punicea ACAM 611]
MNPFTFSNEVNVLRAQYIDAPNPNNGSGSFSLLKQFYLFVIM